MKIPSYRDLLQSTRIINQTRKDLLNKNLMPQRAKRHLTDPNMLKAAIYNYSIEAVKSYRCPVCAITIKCPKEWMIQHTKLHHENRGLKDNEPHESKINPYFY